MTETTEPSIPSARQLAAIDASGWGRSFRLFQPRNLASWVFLLFLAFGAIALFRWAQPSAEAVSTAITWASLLFVLYGGLWLWFLRHLDRRVPIPARLLLCGFLWGALAATMVIALPANDALLSIYTKAVSPEFSQDWGAALAAPFSEEIGKGIGILLLMFIAPRIIRLPFDGFVVGAFVGLGFQLVEDVLYVVNAALLGFGANQIGATISVGILRGVTGIVSHTLYSAIFGAGLVFLLGTTANPANRIRGIGCILIAMVLHGTWDAGAVIGGELGLPAGVIMIGIGLVELAIILIIGRRLAEGEQAWMRDLLAPEIERGTITEAELAALSGSGKDRRRFIKSVKGHHDRRTARHVLEAARDLAQALAESDGHESSAVKFARLEVSRVRLAA